MSRRKIAKDKGIWNPEMEQHLKDLYTLHGHYKRRKWIFIERDWDTNPLVDATGKIIPWAPMDKNQLKGKWRRLKKRSSLNNEKRKKAKTLKQSDHDAEYQDTGTSFHRMFKNIKNKRIGSIHFHSSPSSKARTPVQPAKRRKRDSTSSESTTESSNSSVSISDNEDAFTSEDDTKDYSEKSLVKRARRASPKHYKPEKHAKDRISNPSQASTTITTTTTTSSSRLLPRGACDKADTALSQYLEKQHIGENHFKANSRIHKRHRKRDEPEEKDISEAAENSPEEREAEPVGRHQKCLPPHKRFNGEPVPWPDYSQAQLKDKWAYERKPGRKLGMTGEAEQGATCASSGYTFKSENAYFTINNNTPPKRRKLTHKAYFKLTNKSGGEDSHERREHQSESSTDMENSINKPHDAPYPPLPSRATKYDDDSNPHNIESINGVLLTDDRLKDIEPRLLGIIQNEIMNSGDKVGWDDIAGLKAIKQSIQEVVWPMVNPTYFSGARRPPSGVLLFGPPGTGKTLIGKAIATSSGSTFFNISSRTLMSKWIEEGEKLVRAMFAVARCHQPAVIFIDEIDSLLVQCRKEHESSRRVLNEFLVEWDGAGSSKSDRILVIGATNRPQDLDKAARRRLVKKVYVPLPDEEGREQLIRNLLRGLKHSLTTSDLAQLVALTSKYSGADLASLCSDATYGPARSAQKAGLDVRTLSDTTARPVCLKDFMRAASTIKPKVSDDILQEYEAWDKEYGSHIRTYDSDTDESDSENESRDPLVC